MHGKDDSLFDRLFDQHRRLTRHVISRLLDAIVPGEVDDVIHIVYGRGRRAFRPETAATFKAWILRIARNEAIGRFRACKRGVRLNAVAGRIQLDFQEDAAASADPFSALLRKQRLDLLRGAIDALEKPLSRDVLRLRFLQGLSYDEIATALQIPPGTVMSTIHRSKQEIETWIRARQRQETLARSRLPRPQNLYGHAHP